MDFTTFLWTTFAAFVTLATFSFLYKDNPFYKIAEHLVVGVSAGYFVIILWHNGLVTNLFQKLADGDWYVLWLNSDEWWYIIPAILGMLMWTRFSQKWGWISRWPMSLYIGIATGIAIPLEMSNRVNKQLYAMMVKIEWDGFFGLSGFNLLDTMSGLSQLIVFVGAVSALIYFFFSKAHTGVFGGVAKFGIWILMIGFGSSFGFTVMARISLFIQRLQFLHLSWMQPAVDSSNAQYNAGFPIVFYGFLLMILAYIVYELVTHLRDKGTPAK
ncbi:MAG: hypothetical protein KKA42_10415 [candidate division Zixibacteria bacterium]|nr:hypothetical protein [candidate division Zixibacteria bacterium]